MCRGVWQVSALDDAVIQIAELRQQIAELLQQLDSVEESRDVAEEEASLLRDAWPRDRHGCMIPASAFKHGDPCPACGLKHMDGHGRCAGCGRVRYGK